MASPESRPRLPKRVPSLTSSVSSSSSSSSLSTSPPSLLYSSGSLTSIDSCCCSSSSSSNFYGNNSNSYSALRVPPPDQCSSSSPSPLSLRTTTYSKHLSFSSLNSPVLPIRRKSANKIMPTTMFGGGNTANMGTTTASKKHAVLVAPFHQNPKQSQSQQNLLGAPFSESPSHTHRLMIQQHRQRNNQTTQQNNKLLLSPPPSTLNVDTAPMVARRRSSGKRKSSLANSCRRGTEQSHQSLNSREPDKRRVVRFALQLSIEVADEHEEDKDMRNDVHDNNNDDCDSEDDMCSESELEDAPVKVEVFTYPPVPKEYFGEVYWSREETAAIRKHQKQLSRKYVKKHPELLDCIYVLHGYQVKKCEDAESAAAGQRSSRTRVSLVSASSRHHSSSMSNLNLCNTMPTEAQVSATGVNTAATTTAMDGRGKSSSCPSLAAYDEPALTIEMARHVLASSTCRGLEPFMTPLITKHRVWAVKKLLSLQARFVSQQRQKQTQQGNGEKSNDNDDIVVATDEDDVNDYETDVARHINFEGLPMEEFQQQNQKHPTQTKNELEILMRVWSLRVGSGPNAYARNIAEGDSIEAKKEYARPRAATTTSLASSGNQPQPPPPPPVQLQVDASLSNVFCPSNGPASAAAAREAAASCLDASSSHSTPSMNSFAKTTPRGSSQKKAAQAA